MKAIKTYISVYPVWYRVVVFIVVPVAVIVTGLELSLPGLSSHDDVLIIVLTACALIYAELFGEWFTVGEICARKGAFGEVVLSSPHGDLFVKRFAYTDVLRKVIGYPIIFVVQQLVTKLINPEYGKILDAVVIGLIFALAVIVGIMILRVTKAVAMRFLSFLAMGGISTVLGMPYVMFKGTGYKIAIASLTVILVVLFSCLSINMVIRSSKEDYYDGQNR